MHIISLALDSAWKVLLVSLLLGAGVPAVFAAGVRGLALGNGTTTDGNPPRPAGKVLAIVCFALVAVAVVLGLAIIISSGFGQKLTFEHIYPTFTKK